MCRVFSVCIWNTSLNHNIVFFVSFWIFAGCVAVWQLLLLQRCGGATSMFAGSCCHFVVVTSFVLVLISTLPTSSFRLTSPRPSRFPILSRFITISLFLSWCFLITVWFFSNRTTDWYLIHLRSTSWWRVSLFVHTIVSLTSFVARSLSPARTRVIQPRFHKSLI